MDATCCIDLSSSSESEIDDTVVNSSGGRCVLTKSRILPSWATGNTSQTTHIGNNKYVPESSNFLLIDDGADPSCINSKVSIKNLECSASQPAKSLSCHPSLLSTSKSLTGKSSNSSHFNKTGISFDHDRSDKYVDQYFKKGDTGGTSTTCNNFGRVLPPSLGNTKFNGGQEKLEYDPSIKYGYQHFKMKDHGRTSTVWNNPGRVLPPTMGNINYNGETSATTFNRAGDEGTPAEHDERLVYRAALQDLCQPKVEVDLPNGLLNVSLFRHQKIALAWMLQKETKSLHCSGGILADDQGLGKTISTIALILMQKYLHLKRRSQNRCNQNSNPKVFEVDENRDSVLDEVNQIGESDDVALLFEHKISSTVFHSNKSTAGTLVVCPATVLQQWASELDSLVTNHAKLSVCIYHGGNRKKDVCELSDYDVVLTTYSIVANEVPKHPLGVDDDSSDVGDQENYLSSEISTDKKQKKQIKDTKKGKKRSKRSAKYSFGCSSAGLGRVRWARVVLDEAQTIKNHRTQVAKACCGLRAKRRWCLSGTPIQNSIDDLFSYFQFLRYDPYASYKSFYNAIKIPITRDTDRGYMKLQAILRAVMLRRTKDTKIDGKPIVVLPPKLIKTMVVSFSYEEKAFYLKLEAETRSKFKAYADAGTLKKNYANILLLLLRLRQACDHPLLVKEFNFHRAEKLSIEMARRLPKDMLINLFNILGPSAICDVCDDLPEDSVVTMCGHVFCYQCVSEYLRDDDNTCPAKGCKEQLGEDIVFSKPTIESCLDACLQKTSSNISQLPVYYPDILNDNSSSKIRAALEILQLHCLSKGQDSDHQSGHHHDPSSDACPLPQNMDSFSGTELGKAIIFSQWTGMLDLVELSLKQYCISFRRLDGSMNLPSRDKAVNEFNNDPEVVVMLMSLKAGNLGLNMVAACHVILLDPWWNPTSEDQAIDRAHRIGQWRPVSVTRITVKDTVEDKILCLQEKKRRVVASAFGENKTGGFTHLTEQELRFLFGF